MGLFVNTFNRAINLIKRANKTVSCESPAVLESFVETKNELIAREYYKDFSILRQNSFWLKKKGTAVPVSLDTQNRSVLTDKDYKFFTKNKKNIPPYILNPTLDDLANLKDKYNCQLFVREAGHKRSYNTRALLEAKFDNPEHYADILQLLQLNRMGKIKYVPRFVMPKGKLNPLVKKDMQALIEGKNYFEEFSANTSKLEILSKTSVGDAFSVDNNMFVRTQTGFIKLDFDKNVYKLLFPAVDRYAIAQGFSQNCGPIAVINNLIQVPQNRVKMYKMFEQKGNKIIVHSLGNSFNKSVFDLNDLGNLSDGILSQTCYGLKMLEKHSNKTHQIAQYGIIKPKSSDKYFCKDLISEQGTVFMDLDTVEIALINHSDCEIERLKEKIRTVGKTTTLISGGGGSYDLGTGKRHYISVFDCTNDIVKYSNPNGTAEYREMPLDEFIKKVYGSAFFHKI